MAFQSKGNYFFVKKSELKSNFTQIPNQIFDLELTATEKIILIYLFSNAESFRITKYRIKKSIGSDFRTVQKALDKFRSMNLIYDVNEYCIGINLNQILSTSSNTLSENSGNSTSSNLTSSNPTSSNSTTMIGVIQPLYSSNSTTKMVVELHNNNTKQQEPKKEKQKEANFLVSEVQDNLDSSLKSIYFGREINKKLVDYYLKSQKMKSEFVSYKQFELFFIYVIFQVYRIQEKVLTREILIENLKTEENLNTILSQIDKADTQQFKAIEEFKLVRKFKEFEL